MESYYGRLSIKGEIYHTEEGGLFRNQDPAAFRAMSASYRPLVVKDASSCGLWQVG